MRVLTIVGARPQFIKAMPVSRALASAGIDECLVHTGQHYDKAMSDIFFSELELPLPNLNLGIGSGDHGDQTGRMMMALEATVRDLKPDRVMVYGDTNSTLAGALVAVKLAVPVAHVEAGLRSYNRTMPEEINRILADRCADLLFCPTAMAVSYLAREGMESGVHQVGDTMLDALRRMRPIADEKSTILDRLRLDAQAYLLLTLHRPYNVDRPQRLREVLTMLNRHAWPIVFPVHPRTRSAIRDLVLPSGALRIIEPLGYVDMLKLEANARAIITDSGGIQKEAHMLAVPCLTVRPETEWVETLEAGWNRLVAFDPDAVEDALRTIVRPAGVPPAVFGKGDAAKRIVAVLGGAKA